MPDLATPGPLLRRVGHKGADLIAPGNTFASFDAARDAGVDMIEFDVLPARDGRTLAFAGIELDVDLKLPGYELSVLDALRVRARECDALTVHWRLVPA